MDAKIDIASEIAAGDGVALVEVARLQKTNISTIFRWVIRGLPRGSGERVKLEAIKRGRKWITTRPALTRFFAALPKSAPAPVTPARTPTQRERDSARARQRLQSDYGI